MSSSVQCCYCQNTSKCVHFSESGHESHPPGCRDTWLSSAPMHLGSRAPERSHPGSIAPAVPMAWHGTARYSMAQHSTPHLTTCHCHRASGELRFRIPAISHHLETTQSNNDNTPPKCSAGCILGQDLSEPPHAVPSPPGCSSPGSPAPCSWGGHAACPGVCQLIRDDI